MSNAALESVLQRLIRTRIKLAGSGTAPSLSNPSIDELVSLLEKEADLIVASGTRLQLEQTVQRIEQALGVLLNKSVGTTENGLTELQLVERLESLTSSLPGATASSSSTFSAPTPVTAAVAPAPVDDTAAKAAAAAKAEADKQAAAAAAKKAADEAEAQKKTTAAAAAAPKPVVAATPAVAAKPVVAATPVAATVAASPSPVAPVASSSAGGKTYTYAELKGPVIPGINWAERHLLLTDAEFTTIFKKTKTEFSALAGWKQADAKKAVGLF